MPKISDERLKTYFASSGSYYPLFKEAKDLYDALRVHADGVYPKAMIERRRPSEPQEICDYRRDTYKAITKLPVSKVITSYGKIRRSSDWVIDFPKEKVSSIIQDEESLEKYCTENLPGWKSIENWAFGILLKQNLIDANSVVAVIPLQAPILNEYTQPVPILFNSDQIIEFNENEKFCILLSKRKITYMVDKTNQYGNIFYYIDEFQIVTYEESATGYTVTSDIPNTIGRMPAFKVKAESFKQYDNMSLNRSRLDAMVPFLDEAACEYSDYKASKIQSLYPLMWFYTSKKCNSCGGIGKKPVEGQAPIKCESCEGTGKVKFSPFAHLEVDAAGLGQQANPIPPAGVILRDTEILKLQDASVDKNNFKALAAINMQFLDQTPLSISGDAKKTDREELNNTVYNTAEDLIYSIDMVIDLIADWRYIYVVSDMKKRKAMKPNIPVPQNYDLLPEDYLMQEVTDARTAKINPLLIATLEQQLAAKKFYNQPDLASHIKLFFELDPLPGISVDEKMQLRQANAITDDDFILSTYMASFIKRAIRKNPDFAKFDYDKQMEILNVFVQEKVSANDDAQKIIDAQKKAVLLEMKQHNPGTAGAGKQAVA